MLSQSSSLSGRRRRLVEARLRPPPKPSMQFSRTGLSPRRVFTQCKTGSKWPCLAPIRSILPTSILRHCLLGFSQKELIHGIAFTHSSSFSPRPSQPAAFPSPLGCLSRGHAAFPALVVLFGCPTTRPASLPISLFAYRVAYPVVRNRTSPPGVTHRFPYPAARTHLGTMGE